MKELTLEVKRTGEIIATYNMITLEMSPPNELRFTLVKRKTFGSESYGTVEINKGVKKIGESIAIKVFLRGFLRNIFCFL